MNRKLLRNDQWERIKDLLPGKKGDPGKTGGDNRLFIEAVLWIARTGSPWRDLLPAFGNWHSVYTRYSRWGKKGVWKRLLEQVSDDIDLEQLLLDSTIIRVHQHGAGAKKRRASGHRSLAWWSYQCAVIATNNESMIITGTKAETWWRVSSIKLNSFAVLPRAMKSLIATSCLCSTWCVPSSAWRKC